MQHRRTLQEKAGLTMEAGRLKKHFSTYEPLLQMLRKKYQVSTVTTPPSTTTYCMYGVTAVHDKGEDLGMSGERQSTL